MWHIPSSNCIILHIHTNNEYLFPFSVFLLRHGEVRVFIYLHALLITLMLWLDRLNS